MYRYFLKSFNISKYDSEYIQQLKKIVSKKCLIITRIDKNIENDNYVNTKCLVYISSKKHVHVCII